MVATGQGAGFRLAPGALLILAAALGEAIYYVGQKRYLARYSPLEVATYTIWVATLALLVYLPGLWTGLQAAP